MQTQNYANHTQRVPGLLAIIAILLIAFIYQVYQLVVAPSVAQGVNAVVAGALLLLPFLLRNSTLRVQNRLIRLEMRLRLKEVLPASQQSAIAQLTPAHLVALRFACDEELPALVSEVIAKPELTGKEIKQRVKNWQADFLRA